MSLDTAFSLVQIAQRNGTPPSAPQRKRLGTPASAGTRGRRPRNRATLLSVTAHPVRERRPPAGTPGVAQFYLLLDTARRPPLSTGPPVADQRYRPELAPPTLDIDRSLRRRPWISTGAGVADPGYRPELAPPTLDIDRSLRHRPWISTGAGVADPGYRPELGSPTLDIDRSSRPRPCSLNGRTKLVLFSWTNRISTPVGRNRTEYRRRWDATEPNIDAGGTQPIRCQETPTFTSLGDTHFYEPGVLLWGLGVFGRGRFDGGLAAGRERSDRNAAGPPSKRALVGGGARTRVMPGIPLRLMHVLHASSSVRRASAADGRRSSSSSFSR